MQTQNRGVTGIVLGTVSNVPLSACNIACVSSIIMFKVILLLENEEHNLSGNIVEIGVFYTNKRAKLLEDTMYTHSNISKALDRMSFTLISW